jgi:hypothetical protein
MRFGPAATAGLVLATASILAGCGDEQTTASGAGAPAGKRPARADHAAPRPVATPAERGAAKRCRGSLGELLDSLESLYNAVAVGLAYDGYLSAVNHVRSTYAGVEADRLPFVCLARVASPAERALNAYIAAANAWGECLSTASCDPGSVEPELQREWARASDLVSSAQSSLRASLPGRAAR